MILSRTTFPLTTLPIDSVVLAGSPPDTVRPSVSLSSFSISSKFDDRTFSITFG